MNGPTESAADELVLFADEESAPGTTADSSGGTEEQAWTVLLVDDDREVHEITRIALQRFDFLGKPLRFVSAYSGDEACALIGAHPDTAVILLDVVMETDTAGLDVARYIREVIHNYAVRIILRTGQPGDAPPESIILRYDINDYRTKTELTRERLFTSLLVSLRAYQQIQTIEQQRAELRGLYANLLVQNMELETAHARAAAANQAKGEFLATVGHELRTPLSIILMKGEMLKNARYGPLTAKQEEALQTIERSGKQLLTLVNEMLDMAHVDANQVLIGGTPMTLAEIVDQAMLRVEELLQVGGFSVQVQGLDSKQRGLLDGMRIGKILEQLLENAAKFTPPGGEIGLTVTEAADALTLTVWDTGIGIAPEEHARIFEPFVQLEESLTRRFEGVGLGLAIAARLATQLDGFITVDSAPGQGSRFSLQIPVPIN